MGRANLSNIGKSMSPILSGIVPSVQTVPSDDNVASKFSINLSIDGKSAFYNFVNTLSMTTSLGKVNMQ